MSDVVNRCRYSVVSEIDLRYSIAGITIYCMLLLIKNKENLKECILPETFCSSLRMRLQENEEVAFQT